MRVYLTGFMASGKSTVGPRAAARLGQPFLDLDRLITAHEGRSIPTVFAEDGEDYFRTLETEMLPRTTETDDPVVAVGGGEASRFRGSENSPPRPPRTQWE